MIRSDINKSLISNFSGSKISENLQVSANNLPLVYCREQDYIQTLASSDDKTPKVFNYYGDGEQAFERTNVVCENKYVSLTTYFKDGKEWSSLDVKELTPNGIIHCVVFVPSGSYVKNGDVNVSISFCSNNELESNGIDVDNLHPMNCQGSLIKTTLLNENLGYMGQDSLNQFVCQVCNLGLQDFYSEMKDFVEQRKAETDQQAETVVDKGISR